MLLYDYTIMSVNEIKNVKQRGTFFIDIKRMGQLIESNRAER